MNLNLLNSLKKNSSPFSCVVNHTLLKIHRLEIPLDEISDPIHYLENTLLYPKVFWKGKHNSEITLGLGSIYSVSEVPTFRATERDSSPKFFGGLFFDNTYTSTERLWGEFSPGYFFIPQIEILLGERPTLYYNYLEEDKEEPIKPFLKQHSSVLPPFITTYAQRINTPSQEKWNHLVKAALHSFDTTPLQKVVLARACHLTYSNSLNPLSVLKHLSNQNLNCTLFAYLLSENCGFVGATPEYLYQRDRSAILTEAVAGTRPRSSTPEEEERLVKELLSKDKEQREFNHVTTFLTKKLESLCKHYTNSSSQQIIKTASIQHLYQRFDGILNPSVTDQDMIKALHPTPAMGGFPQNLALDFLATHEPFSRGHYAAPLGWISPKQTELSVAIRCGLIKKSTMTLFSGAGIVPGSHPQQEWEELELKIAPFLNAYGS